MLTPQDIMDRLKELVLEKFPGEPVYLDKQPSGWGRPSTLITLGSCAGNANYGVSIVELTPVIKLTTFSEVDQYHDSHLRVLNQRLMVLTGLLLPGYIKVNGRAPKVRKLEMECGYDYAELAATFGYTLDRNDFMEAEQAPLMEHLRFSFTEQ